MMITNDKNALHEDARRYHHGGFFLLNSDGGMTHSSIAHGSAPSDMGTCNHVNCYEFESIEVAKVAFPDEVGR